MKKTGWIYAPKYGIVCPVFVKTRILGAFLTYGKTGHEQKTTSKIAFNSGEFVVYPAHGVGKVADISTQKIGGAELELIVVNFDKDKMTLRVPLSKAESVGLRKISETPVMDEALGVLKGKAKVRKIMWSRRAQEYENKINSGSPVAIAEVVRDLYRRENLSEQSYSERQIYEQALDRLANEYAICNNISAGDATKKLLDILASDVAAE